MVIRSQYTLAFVSLMLNKGSTGALRYHVFAPLLSLTFTTFSVIPRTMFMVPWPE